MHRTTERPRRVDLAHHHPQVRRTFLRTWCWECPCGGTSGRELGTGLTWRDAVVGALLHSMCISP